MLKKIFLWMLVLWSCIWITQATNIITWWREFLQLSNWEEWYFTNNKITKAETNQFDITSNWWWNRTYTFNWINYSNVFKIIITNRQVPSYIWLWNTNNELVYASSYLWKWYTPTKVCKIEDGDYTKINQDNCYTTDITELYTEEANLEYLTFWQQIDQTVDNISVRDRNAICFKFVNWITYCAKCWLWANWCQWWQTQVFNNNANYELQDYANIAWLSPWNAWWWWNKFTPLPMCYTIQQKIDSYPSQYNIEMCYSSNKIWSWWQFVTVTPKSMLELRPTYQEYVDDVNLYQNYCGNYVATQQACSDAFTWRNEQRSIINKLYNQWQQTMLRSYDYCYLQLNFTEEQKTTRTNCTMWTGTQHGSWITTDDIIEDMQNHKITIIAPDGTTVYSWFWNKSENETGANLSYDWIIESMQNVRWKLTSIFYYRSWVDWIIPDYIIWILLLIVLFAVFKK